MRIMHPHHREHDETSANEQTTLWRTSHFAMWMFSPQDVQIEHDVDVDENIAQ